MMSWPDNSEAIKKYRDVFRLHGFDDYDIDFSSVKPEAIEAMAAALIRLLPSVSDDDLALLKAWSSPLPLTSAVSKRAPVPVQHEWCWSRDSENWTCVPTREEAISEATADAEGRGLSVIHIAQCQWATHENLVTGLGEDVRDMLVNRAYDDAGEHADNYPDMPDKPFDDALEAFVLAWLNEHADHPRFYTPCDEETIHLGDDNE